MLISSFNSAREKERVKIETRLKEQLSHEIDSLSASALVEDIPEHKQELLRMRANLILRHSLVMFESEEISRHRMQLRTSYLALFMSGMALLVSVIVLVFK